MEELASKEGQPREAKLFMLLNLFSAHMQEHNIASTAVEHKESNLAGAGGKWGE